MRGSWGGSSTGGRAAAARAEALQPAARSPAAKASRWCLLGRGWQAAAKAVVVRCGAIAPVWCYVAGPGQPPTPLNAHHFLQSLPLPCLPSLVIACPQAISLPKGSGYGNCRPTQEPQPGSLCELGADATDPEEGDITSRVGARPTGRVVCRRAICPQRHGTIRPALIMRHACTTWGPKERDGIVCGA